MDIYYVFVLKSKYPSFLLATQTLGQICKYYYDWEWADHQPKRIILSPLDVSTINFVCVCQNIQQFGQFFNILNLSKFKQI